MMSIRAGVRKSNNDIPSKAPFLMKYSGASGKIDSIGIVNESVPLQALTSSTSYRSHEKSTQFATLFLFLLMSVNVIR